MRILLIAVAIWLVPLCASAYAPHTGDRAANIYGRDIIGGGVVHLDDYLGKWVLVDFWGTW